MYQEMHVHVHRHNFDGTIFDGALNKTQNKRFLNIYNDLIKQMVKQTEFSEIELTCILLIYHKFVLLNGPKTKMITKKQFFNLFEILFEICDLKIISRIMVLMSRDTHNHISPAAWVKLFSVFMSDSLDEKMEFVFSVYNLHESIYLTRDVISKFVDEFFSGEDEDEVLELSSDMTDMLIKKFDVDRDGKISYEDYATTVRKNPMLMEFLGHCLPSREGLTITAYCSFISSKLDED